MPHVDMAKVEASLAKAREALKPLSNEDTSMGAQARMSMVVDTAFSRCMAQEINRGTSVEFVSDALAAVCANMISSLAQSALGYDIERAEMVRVCDALMINIARCLMMQFSGEAEDVYHGAVDLENGGHA